MGTLGRPVEVAFIKFGITRLVVDRMIYGINVGRLADVDITVGTRFALVF
jgi:hypothetical protein